MNYSALSDVLWYGGHILTGISILFTRDQFYLAVGFVLFGQLITIISRPISRMKTTKPRVYIDQEEKEIDATVV